jgi:hypothetical protein
MVGHRVHLYRSCTAVEGRDIDRALWFAIVDVIDYPPSPESMELTGVFKSFQGYCGGFNRTLKDIRDVITTIRLRRRRSTDSRYVFYPLHHHSQRVTIQE